MVIFYILEKCLLIIKCYENLGNIRDFRSWVNFDCSGIIPGSKLEDGISRIVQILMEGTYNLGDNICRVLPDVFTEK